MTQALIEDLRAAVTAYRRDGDDFHLWNWIREAQALCCWRDGGLGRSGIFVHLFPRKEIER